ncbi:MAG TPA: STAS domain-containing protein [Candidatus Saccharimonadales bacterium]|jgi:anti-anti-sigma factor|nr:STAS domain-containing protein [Candidatus Saccharimonadales bacterium]
MAITTEELEGGITKVVLDGRLDIENAPAVDSQMKTIAGGRNSVLVDMSNVSFLGSMGLRALVGPALAIRGRGGKMVLFAPNEMVAKVLKISGIETMIPVHHEMNTALAALL